MTIAARTEAVCERPFVLVAQCAAVLGVWLAFYYPVIQSLVREWYEHDNFSYGFLIPFIFLYLIWDRRDAFKLWLAAPNLSGAMIFLSALVFGAAGQLFSEPLVARLSMVIALIALVQLFWGSACVKRLAFPLCYLFLMIPPPYVLIKPLAYHLRMFDAKIATSLVQALGVPVYRDAYFMHLPDITLEVADVCSGTSSLFAMMALGTLYVYYLPARLLARLAVLSGAFIFPVIANLFRIFLVTVSVYYYGAVMLGAFYHHFTGTFTFVLSLAMFLLAGEVARRKYPQSPPGLLGVTTNKSMAPLQSTGFRSALPIVGVLVAGLLILYALHSRGLSSSPSFHVDLERLSPQISGFVVTPQNLVHGYTDRQAEQSLSRLYASATQPIELFVGFSSRQFDGNRLQSPQLIFPEHWEYAAIEAVEIPVSAGNSIDATGLLTKRNEEQVFVLFWYQRRGRAFSSDLRNRLELLKNFVVEGRSDGAVVRLATPVGRFESSEQARARLVSFAKDLYPELESLLPN